MEIEPTDVLEEFSKMFGFLTDAAEQLSLTLTAFDKNYLRDVTAKSTETLAMQLLAEASQKNKSQLEQLSRRLLEEVERDREGKNVDKGRIERISSYLQCVGYFEADFKRMFATYAEDHYKKYLAARLPIADLAAYTREVSEQMVQERGRCETLFDDHLAQMLYFLMKRILVDDVIGEILNSNFERLILDNMAAEIKFFYDVMKDTDVFDTFLAFFEGFVKNKAEAILGGDKDAAVEGVKDFYFHLNKILREVYADDQRIKAAIDRSLEGVIAKSDQLFARLLSCSISSKLTKSMMTKAEAQCAVSDAMTLFKFVQNKRSFIQHYNQR